jgi:hypothetical protein
MTTHRFLGHLASDVVVLDLGGAVGPVGALLVARNDTESAESLQALDFSLQSFVVVRRSGAHRDAFLAAARRRAGAGL